jgi:hypothetical protein
MNLFISTFILVAAFSAINQSGKPAQPPNSSQSMAPRANEGHLPPQPSARGSGAGLGGERLQDGRMNNTPHVNHNQWFGHDSPNDPMYRLDRPFTHGRFDRSGPKFRYRFLRVDPYRHWFWLPGGQYFAVASWDWPAFADWCWGCGDDFVVYDDPDHGGWYLVYNIHTGVYVHVQYMGT